MFDLEFMLNKNNVVGPFHSEAKVKVCLIMYLGVDAHGCKELNGSLLFRSRELEQSWPISSLEKEKMGNNNNFIELKSFT